MPFVYVAPHTIVPGELVTVETMNDEWGGNITSLFNPPACRVRRTSDQSVPDNTNTAITFDAERWDTDSMHSTVTQTSRITINTAGLYMVTGEVAFASAGSATRLLSVRLNGSTEIVRTQGVFNLAAHLTVATVYKFAAADYIEMIAYQATGGPVNVLALANYSPEFAATWIGLG